MAIAPVNGAVASSAVGVTSLTLTYSPATGNTVLIGVLLKTSSGSVIVLQDNLGNTYANDAVVGSSAVWHISSVPAGVTGFTASGFTSQTLVMAIEEYSGAAGALYLSTTSTASISGTIPYANDYIVGLAIAGSALTITAGTQRQVTGAVNGDNLVIADITSATPGSLTLTESGATGFIVWFAYLVGGPGTVRDSQDVTLSVTQPTTATARSSQDINLPVALPSTALVRASQDVVLTVVSNNILLQLHVKKPITAWQMLPETRQPFGFLQSAALLGATPVYLVSRPFGILIAQGVHEEEHANRPWIGRVPAARRRRPLGWVVS